jgi:hypothetical protein
MGSPRRLPHLLSPNASSNHNSRPVQGRKLPAGIAAHWDVVPDDLLACYEDIVELDTTAAKGLRAHHAIDDMQASIESRLETLGRLCKDFGVAAECSRLAAFICCYTSYVEVWKTFLIPCRCASLLSDALASSFDDPTWIKRRDLQLWLVLVGSCTAMLDQGHLEHLKSSYDILVRRIINTVSTWPWAQISLQRALRDFIYPETLFHQHQDNREWLRLVASIGSCAAFAAPDDPHT